MAETMWMKTRNAVPVKAAEVPVVGVPEFRQEVAGRVLDGAHLIALFGVPEPAGDQVRLFAVLGRTRTGDIELSSTIVGDRYPALTPICTAGHWFEREIAEQWGVVPEGHPWLKPIRFHPSYVQRRDAWLRPRTEAILPCVTEYFQLEGDQIHEVAVGPVHAGVIEPGHFRFQCHGEYVHHLEISLGYQHRGIERALIGGPSVKTRFLMETAAGDTTIGHTLAYVQAMESLAGVTVPVRAHVIRGVALELERLANHTGDLGALAGDVGFLPTASFCGRLRGDFLNLTAVLCGSRFGRGLLIPGGVAFDFEPERIKSFLERLQATAADVENAVTLLFASSSVLARFEHTGPVSRDTAVEIGLVGPAARASGVDYDVRRDYPTGSFATRTIPIAPCGGGDVFARAMMRWEEIRRSVAYIQNLLQDVPQEAPGVPVGPPAADRIVVSLVEGWRGAICHVVATGPGGRFPWYKVVDPSFHNWFGLAMSLRNQQISDFPLCNKSFNLSYCGHDL